MTAQEMEQLAPLRVPVDNVLPSPVGSSQILVDNEGYRHLQLAEQLTRLVRDAVPIHWPVALFFRQDLTEPELQLVDVHA
jgi:hypothetical protein